MTTVGDVLTKIFALLPTPSLGTGKTFDRWYKYAYPDGHSAPYFGVLNTLTVPVDPIQDVDININFFAADIDTSRGIPDLSALNAAATSVVTALHNINDNEVDIEFRFMSIIRDETANRHYMNMRFVVVYINN